MSSADLIKRIRSGVIGQYHSLHTPYGRKPLVYADYTASGRALDFIEAQIQSHVLPFYANTHSESSFTGAQTTGLREQARRTIANALKCCAADKIIFCGSGATAAINRLIDILNLRLPADLDKRYALSAHIPHSERPIVFIGPYEHHSNELPWRESIADLVAIPLDSDGQIDQHALQDALHVYRDRPMRIGSFSAASNVTGVLSDVSAITQLLKSHGALAFWDYAAAGPYVGIDMNRRGAEIDAVFMSPHKFIGGPGTPGILAVKSQLLTNTVPAVVGGGTVAFVSPHHHRYLCDAERREEAGTPAIVESIRAGLVFALQQRIGTDTIETLERTKVAAVRERLGQQTALEMLGPDTEKKLAIFALRFVQGRRELHYGFVVALLNDLFGIQARGGCSCAGPYGHELLGLDEKRSLALDAQVAAGYASLRPGWVRLNFNYFIGTEEFAYLLSAVELVAEHGWRMLPAYTLDPKTGMWRHRDHIAERATDPSPELNPELDLEIDFEPVNLQATAVPDFDALLHDASEVLQAGASHSQHQAARADRALPETVDALRWFALPGDVASPDHPLQQQEVAHA
ncbi:MAG: aminotransferase class V-fold PLP-dependent enzyme [Congregibacter sp.]